MTLITPDFVFDGETLRNDLSVIVDQTVQLVPRDAAGQRFAGAIAPGYIDLQVNGGGGVLVNTQPQALDALAAAHRRFGTVALLPTVITDRPEVLDSVTEVMLRRHTGEAGDPIVGLHIEGPHIALSRRGTHDARSVRPLDERTMRCLRDLRAAGIPVLLTLAPEVVPPGQIAQLVELGVIVSLGHSDATAAQARAGFAAGAQAVTHLFNAMSPLGHREPGMVGAALTDAPFVGLIADGIHVDDTVLPLVFRAVAGRVFLVSDAMPTVGGPSEFNLYGATISVRDGRLINAEGALAGAHTTMAEGVARLIRLGLPPQAVLAAAITHPAALIGRRDLSVLQGRSERDVVWLGGDWMPTKGPR